MNTDLSPMYLNIRLSRLLIIAAFLLTISVLGVKAQVAPSKKIAKILKSIYTINQRLISLNLMLMNMRVLGKK